MIGVGSSLVSRLVLNLRGWSKSAAIRADLNRRVKPPKQRSTQPLPTPIELSAIRTSPGSMALSTPSHRGPSLEWEYRYDSKQTDDASPRGDEQASSHDMPPYPHLRHVRSNSLPFGPIIIERQIKTVVDRGSLVVEAPSSYQTGTLGPRISTPSILSVSTWTDYVDTGAGPLSAPEKSLPRYPHPFTHAFSGLETGQITQSRRERTRI